ncbi:MAG: ATP-binding protein [Pseudomonadota bacterium]|nr:ATP-binding protein [Pseudomonadota bacterium]
MSDLTQAWHYDRTRLATTLGDRLIRHERIAMFGPRQTGKTTLLRDEVIPYVQSRDCLAIYIDCWMDMDDPLQGINYALQKALDGLAVKPRGLRRTGSTVVKKLGLMGASIDLGEPPKRQTPARPGLVFDSLLTQILEETRHDVVLVFDEFQAIASVKNGPQISASLRAALTQADKRIGAIFSGSSDVQLLDMFSRTSTPLYGFARTEGYEPLGLDFIGFVARKFKEATRRDLNIVLAQDAFQELGTQPEPFLHAVSLVMANPKWSLANALDEMLGLQSTNKWSATWRGLTGLQQAALKLIFDDRAPTSADSVAWAANQLGARVQPSSISRALEALGAKGILERKVDGRGWSLIDPVQRAWLRRNPHAPVKSAAPGW